MKMKEVNLVIIRTELRESLWDFFKGKFSRRVIRRGQRRREGWKIYIYHAIYQQIAYMKRGKRIRWEGEELKWFKWPKLNILFANKNERCDCDKFQ